MKRFILIDSTGQQHWRRFHSYQAASEYRFAHCGSGWSIARE